MRKVLKWIGIVLGSALALLLVAAVAMMISTNVNLNKTYDITPETISIPTDAASIAEGGRWVASLCINCHGENLAGTVMLDDPALGYFDSANLTSGKGGKGSTYTDADWVRAIRHGVRADGRSVLIMPADDFFYMSDADLGAIIAYVKSVPPVDQEMRQSTFKPMGSVLYALGAFGNLLKASAIPDHSVRPAVPPVGVTAEYGGYLVTLSGCRSCHGPELAGGKSAEPGAPWAPNLTDGGELLVWDAEDLITTFRTGVTPSGHKLLDYMPWQEFKNRTDEEITAIFMYLKSLPRTESVVP